MCDAPFWCHSYMIPPPPPHSCEIRARFFLRVRRSKTRRSLSILLFPSSFHLTFIMNSLDRLTIIPDHNPFSWLSSSSFLNMVYLVNGLLFSSSPSTFPPHIVSYPDSP
ncbi:hypothetical protein L218DRAFT_677281 [Marasmius fiardii PR-910]|nr:hypothetical protein L218DRAFT_677281 [Marasmius fiardii PR-910]